MPPSCCECKFQYVYRYLLTQFVDGSNWLYVIEVPRTGFVRELKFIFIFLCVILEPGTKQV